FSDRGPKSTPQANGHGKKPQSLGSHGLTFLPGVFICCEHTEDLSGKPLEALQALANATRRTLTLKQLKELVWPGCVVTEDAVRSVISVARAALRRALE